MNQVAITRERTILNRPFGPFEFAYKHIIVCLILTCPSADYHKIDTAYAFQIEIPPLRGGCAIVIVGEPGSISKNY